MYKAISKQKVPFSGPQALEGAFCVFWWKFPDVYKRQVQGKTKSAANGPHPPFARASTRTKPDVYKRQPPATAATRSVP